MIVLIRKHYRITDKGKLRYQKETIAIKGILADIDITNINKRNKTGDMQWTN